MVVADFNGDGKPDLATAAGMGVSVLFGNGDGTFQPAQNFPAGNSPNALVVGDFDGDGTPDLAVTNAADRNVSILLNKGDGTFRPPVNDPVGAAPTAIAAGDFNGDGKIDLVVATTTDVRVLLGNGDGTFRAAVTYAAGQTPQSVAVADLNGDGKLDLAVANIGSGNVSVLLGNGDGTFKSSTPFSAGPSPIAVTVGDFNGDGKADLAVANYARSGSVSVLLGNGNGTFQTPTAFATAPFPYAVATQDINGDGNLDLMTANIGSGNVSTLAGNGDGTFQPAVNYTVGLNPVGLAAADVNGDSKPDLLVANLGANSVSVLLNQTIGGRLAVSAPSSTNAGEAVSITVTALDFSGRVDPTYRGTVHFSSTDVAALLPASYTFTAADTGSHTFTLTLRTSGRQSFTATDMDRNINGMASITVAPGPVSTLVVSGFPSPSTAGVAANVTVTARDTYGNPAAGYLGTVTFSSSDAQAVLPADYTFTTADNGVHTFSATLKSAGSQSLTATDRTTSTLSGRQTGLVVNPAAASNLVVGGFPSPTLAGVAGSITVTAKDPYGNTVAAYLGTVRFSSSDAQAALPAAYTFVAADNGMHTFSATLKTAGSQTLTVTDGASLAGSQSGILVNAGTVSALSLSGFPASIIAGASGNFTVTAKDAYGNTTAGYVGTVTFSSSDLQAVLPADYTFTTTDNGVHTFSATLKTAGSQSLTATDRTTSTLSGRQSGLIVNPAAASNLVLGGFPSPTLAGVAGSVTVTAKDPYGNTVTAYLGTVHFSSSDPQAVLPAMYTFVAADNGMHTFSATLKTAGSQSLTATDATSLSGIQGNILVNPAAADHLSLTGPATAAPGAPFALTVTARDPFNNIATGYRGTIHVTSSDPQATLPADYAFTAADAGTHAFNVVLATIGSQTITGRDVATGSITGTATINVALALFRPPVRYPVGLSPSDVVAADFNGDGIPDLAVVNSGDDSLSILLGQGDGTFVPAGVYATGLMPDSIAVGDFNGDGIPDLVVANHDSNTLTVYLGQGDGSFQAAGTYESTLFPSSVIVGDFNGDGNLDLVTANSGTATVAVLLGNGDGTFQPPQYQIAGSYPVFVAAADLNGDGNLDLVTANPTNNTISILLGNGDGTFQTATVLRALGGPVAMLIADLNGDGQPDLVLANQTGNNVSVLLGNGDGTFQAAVNYAAGTGPVAVQLGDVTGDGLPDLIVLDQAENSVRILPGNGDGTFQASLKFALGTSPTAVALGDFDQDGNLDLAVTDRDANDVAILLNAGDWPTLPGPTASAGQKKAGSSEAARPPVDTALALDEQWLGTALDSQARHRRIFADESSPVGCPYLLDG